MTQYTEQQLLAALRKADAAGDVAAARAIARRIAQARKSSLRVEAPAKTAEELTPGVSTNPTDGMGTGARVAASVGSAAQDLMTAGKQSAVDFAQFGAEGGLYGAAARAVMPGAFEQRDVRSLVSGQPSRAPQDVGGRLSDMLQPTDDAMRAQQAERNATDAPLMDTAAGKVGYGGTMLASLLAGPAAITRGTQAASFVLPRTLAGNVAQGAALGATTQPLATGDSRLTNAGIGAGAGAIGHGVAAGLQKWGTSAANAIAPEAREVFEAAKARGINLTPAQLSDSRFIRGLQSMLRSMPFTGAQARHGQQVAGVNREIAKSIGEDAPQVTSNVYAMAKARQSRKFNELTERNDLRVDNDVMQSLFAVVEDSKLAGDEVRGQVEAAIERLARSAVAGPNGVIVPGRAYQAFDSDIGKALKAGGTPSHYLGQVQSVVREAMDRSISPADAQAWSALRREYGNRKTIAPLVARSADAPISPPQLMGAVTNSNWAKEAMASGSRGELGELAKIGQRIKEPPSSGTAERMMFGGAVNPVNWPGLVAGAAVGAPVSRALDSKGLAALMMRENPGMRRKAAAKTAGALAKLLGLQVLPVAADEG